MTRKTYIARRQVLGLAAETAGIITTPRLAWDTVGSCKPFKLHVAFTEMLGMLGVDGETTMSRSFFSPSVLRFSAVVAVMAVWWYITSLGSMSLPNIYGNYHFDDAYGGIQTHDPSKMAVLPERPSPDSLGLQQIQGHLFKLSGNDPLIVPVKYLAELASMPPEKLSLNTAIVNAFQRLRSINAVITDHSLQSRMLTSRLTPRLGLHVPRVQTQLRKHLPHDLPATAGGAWTSVNALRLARRLVHRSTAAQFVTELAEDEEYLATVVSYSENGFKHNLFLRVLPDWAKPVVARLVPTSWRVDWALRRAKRMIIPLIRERRRREQEEDPTTYAKPEDFLQHLMDGGREIAAAADDDATMVQRLMVTYLGSGPSTIAAVVQVLFDLCAHPQYVEPLRQGALEVLRSTGGYTMQALADMKMLDSFMRESQRLNPPTLLGFNAVMRQPLTLHDGTVLPEGAHIQMATYEIGYRNRQRPGESNKHQYTTTSENNLHFGHGKIVCPGRFFADHSIKMIVSNILLRYHLRFPGGSTQRPPNSSMYGVVIPDLGACVEFKLRDGAVDCDF
ncbi:hypothetical protein VTK56DRAFT_2612 [Thermocarpiscus australiensis]